jgi:serine/threonine-protein kinase
MLYRRTADAGRPRCGYRRPGGPRAGSRPPGRSRAPRHPSNILVHTEDEDDHVYLIDFGIARALDGTRLTVAGKALGTPAYMAPERFVGAGDESSDIYSLGCVLYHALVGQPPFDAPDVIAYAHFHCHVEPSRPSAHNAAVPAALDLVVARALAKAPQSRYPTASEFAAAARTALVEPSLTITSRTPTTPRDAVPTPTRVDLGPGSPAEQGREICIPPHRIPNPDRRSRLVAAVQRAVGHPEPPPSKIRPMHREVFAVATSVLDGAGAIAVVGCRDGSIWLVDLATGNPLPPPSPDTAARLTPSPSRLSRGARSRCQVARMALSESGT